MFQIVQQLQMKRKCSNNPLMQTFSYQLLFPVIKLYSTDVDNDNEDSSNKVLVLSLCNIERNTTLLSAST